MGHEPTFGFLGPGLEESGKLGNGEADPAHGADESQDRNQPCDEADGGVALGEDGTVDLAMLDQMMDESKTCWDDSNEWGLLDDGVTLRLGKQDVNTEFLLVEMAEDFIQSSFGLSPSSAGLPTYPDPGMAAVLLRQLTDQTRFKLGIWDGLASGGSWGSSGNEVILLIAGAGFQGDEDQHQHHSAGEQG